MALTYYSVVQKGKPVWTEIEIYSAKCKPSKYKENKQ